MQNSFTCVQQLIYNGKTVTIILGKIGDLR